MTGPIIELKSVERHYVQGQRKLTVLNGAEKSELLLEPAGDNTLATKDEARLARGAKAIAALTFADKKAVNVRFSMK